MQSGSYVEKFLKYNNLYCNSIYENKLQSMTNLEYIKRFFIH